VSGAVGSGGPLSVIWGPPDSSSVSSRSPVCLMRGLRAPSRWQNFLELRVYELRGITLPRTPVNKAAHKFGTASRGTDAVPFGWGGRLG
jgi:hypothetical protein